MKLEKTLIIIKPDAVARRLSGRIVQRLEDKGLRIVAMKMTVLSKDLAATHYQEHKEKPFYRHLIDFITTGPVILMVIEGGESIKVCRDIMGDTNSAHAGRGTIRGDYALSKTFNLVHGSDSEESARREIANFFEPHEILELDNDVRRWIDKDPDS